MSKIRVNRIENNSTADGGIDIDTSGHVKADGLQMPTAGPLSARNILINGAMTVNQRHGGSAVTATTNAEYSLDRWRTVSSASSKFTVQRVNRADLTPPEGFSHSMKITSSAATTVGANDYYVVQQRIEGTTLQGFCNSQTPIAISFYIRSSLTGTFSGVWENSAVLQYYPFQFAINSANTWEYKTVIVPGSGNNYLDGNAKGANLTFNLGAGTNYTEPASSWTTDANSLMGADNSVNLVGTSGATMYITGVQVEVGSKSTPFEHRSYGDELLRCQRYFQKTCLANALVSTSTQVHGNYQLFTEMRSMPTLLQQGVIEINDNSVNNTQSAVSVTGYGTGQFRFIQLGNFSGLTTHRPAFMRFGANQNLIYLDSEL